MCLVQAAASAFTFYDLDSSGLISKAEIMKMIELQPIGSHYERGPRGHTVAKAPWIGSQQPAKPRPPLRSGGLLRTTLRATL